MRPLVASTKSAASPIQPVSALKHKKATPQRGESSAMPELIPKPEAVLALEHLIGSNASFGGMRENSQHLPLPLPLCPRVPPNASVSSSVCKSESPRCSSLTRNDASASS